MTVHQLETTMPASEFYKWIEYTSSHPFNTAEVQLASLTSLIASHLGIEAEIEDFMVTKRSKDKEPQTTSTEALESYLKGFA